MHPSTAAGYLLLKRSYHGLECPAVGSADVPVQDVQQGRSGRAAEYTAEGQ